MTSVKPRNHASNPNHTCFKCTRTISKNNRHINCKVCNNKYHLKCNTLNHRFNKTNPLNMDLDICFPCVIKNSKCGVCSNKIAKNHRHIECTKCFKKVHIKCNGMDTTTFNNLEDNKIYCINCKPDNFPFQNISDALFLAENSNKISISPKSNLPKLKCLFCKKTIAKNHRKIECHFCNNYCHLKCNGTDTKTYNNILKQKHLPVCLNCHPLYKHSHYLPEISPVQIRVTCNVCNKTISSNHRRIHCSCCDQQSHIKCNKIDPKLFEQINKNKSILCITCKNENIPFHKIDDIELAAVNKCINVDCDLIKEKSVTSLSLKKLFSDINKASDFNSSHPLPLKDDESDEMVIDCKYVDLCDFKPPSFKKNISLFHTNIGSLEKHFEELQTVLKMLDFKFDVIGISESKLKKEIKPKSSISLPGYKIYHVGTEADKGGSLIYVSTHLNTKPRKDLEKILYKSEMLESTFMEIIVPNRKNIIVGNIYRHPSMYLEEYLDDYLTPFLNKISKENKRKIIMGDFNVDLMKVDDNDLTAKYFDIMTSHLFVPHIVHPTRITSTSKTLIDNIFSNATNMEEAKSGNLTISLSDHLAQFLFLPNDLRKSEYHKKSKSVIDHRKLDQENYILDMFDFNWDISNFADPNNAFAFLENHIDQVNKKHIHTRELTKKEMRDLENPWIDTEIKTMIKKRNLVHTLFIKTSDKEKKDELKSRYKKLRNDVTSKIRSKKRKYYEDFFNENSDNLRNTWRGIKSIINLDKSSSSPNSLIKENKLISDPKEVATEFNKYFSNIAENLQSQIHTEGQNFQNYLKNPNENTIFLKATSKIEILNTITTHIKKKGTGPHSVPHNILHLIKDIIAQPLADILNLSFQTGIYIENLKISRVVPIFKEKGSDLSPENYRPISLLSNINKIFEKIMHKRVYEFMEKHNLIYPHQFGFRLFHSTVHALTDMTESIRGSIDENKFVAGIFIDLQKAFDTVDHSILLSKLGHYGIRGVANNWFRSYLSDRKQFVSINDEKSDMAPMNYGVPQGSVLGPLLFLIYINDLHNAIIYSKTCHFADDTAILYANHSLKQLQKHVNIDLKHLCHWLKANKISLNAGKTELMIFRNPHRLIDYDLKIKINGKIIIPSSKVKYLGVILDPHLNGSAHVNYIAPKLNRAVGMLSKLRHFVSNQTAMNVYHAIFGSIMNYGCLTWAQNPNSHVFRIGKIQNKAIKIINFAQHDDDVELLYPKNRIIKFIDQVKMENLLYAHASIKGNIPGPLRNQFLIRGEHCDPSTRGSTLTMLILPKVRTQGYGIYSIKYKATAYWNLIMNNIPDNNFINLTKNTVKEKLLTYFFNVYNNNLTV